MEVVATIIAVSEAAKAAFTFAATTQGQAIVERWLKDADAWDATIAKAGAWLENLAKSAKNDLQPTK